MNLIIYAPNVHQGGGLTLLNALLEAAPQARTIVDERLVLPASFPKTAVISKTKPNIHGRLKAEIILSRHTKPGDMVLCFGNLPPLFKISGRSFLFIQNRYLLGDYDTRAFPRSVRLRIAIERRWLRARVSRIENVIVQSLSMAQEVEATLGITPWILPFIPGKVKNKRRNNIDNFNIQSNFLYVASPEPQKNHRNLIEAWVLLAKKNIRPNLVLTINTGNAPSLVKWIKPLIRDHDLRIDLIGPVSHSRVMELYGEVGALIYPSNLESMGLPLWEASSSGLPILAGELDFVRDMVDPVETFDPSSPLSIARAVGRFLRTPLDKTHLLTPVEFIDALLSQE